MAGYSSGRRNGVNVSQYIANLNKEPSAFEVARSEEQDYLVDDEHLAQFTNTEFFDFDTADFLNDANNAAGGLAFDDNAKAEKQEPTREKTSSELEFANGAFPTQAVSPFDINTSLSRQPQQPQTLFPDYNSQPGLPLPNYHQTTSPPTSTAFPPTYPTAQTAVNPTAAASHASPTDSSSDPSRALAEEDKRRRNTAASARFRVKKKQREQALEQKTQEMEKAKQVLEQRVSQLETENEWLRGLVVEKNGGGLSSSSSSKDQGGPESETDGGKKGVGTDT